jgi:hypothetical protein
VHEEGLALEEGQRVAAEVRAAELSTGEVGESVGDEDSAGVQGLGGQACCLGDGLVVCCAARCGLLGCVIHAPVLLCPLFK